jgi:hypothetical protein
MRRLTLCLVALSIVLPLGASADLPGAAITLPEPELTVTSDVLPAPVIVTGIGNAPVFVDVPANTPLIFCWTVDAASYGGTASYRYGWDITDVSDDAQFEIDWTPIAEAEEACSPVKMFQFGVHVITIEALDNADVKTRLLIYLNIDPVLPVEQTTWGAVKALFQ